MQRPFQQLIPGIKRGLPSLFRRPQGKNIPRIDLERLRALRRAQPINVGPSGFGGNQLIPGPGSGMPRISKEQFAGIAGRPRDPSSFFKNIENKGPESLMRGRPPLLLNPRLRDATRPEPTVNLPPDVQLPEGVLPGGRFFTGPNGERLYQPPMPPGKPGMAQAQVMPPPINLDTGEVDVRSIGGLGGLPIPPPQGRPAPVDPFREGVRPSEVFGPDGQIIGPAGSSADVIGGNLPAERPPVQAGGRDRYNQITPARRPETTVNLPPDVQVQDAPPPPVAPVSSPPAADAPFATSVRQVASGLDPLTEQLLFGVGGQGGFIPGAMRAAERTFFDAEGNPIVIDEQVAGFSPDQLAAMQLQRQSVGIQNPFLQQAAGAYGTGIQSLEEGLRRGRSAAIGSLGATAAGVGSLQEGLGESADILRGTIGGYDPSMTRQFYDPFEDQVVQQTISDIMEQGAKGDIAARAGDIARGGQSAFGSRARLGAGERQEALGRGLAEALSGIRSRGFREAQQTGLGEFARQKAAERAAASGLAGLAGQGFGGSQALAGALSGLGQTEQNIGQQRMSGQFGLGSSLQGLGAQAAGASASDISALYGMGSQQQAQMQRMLDAQRRNLQQRQMAPLAQFQALQPFVSMAPAGQFQTITDFAPRPSAVQAGLGTGLAAFGALGQLYGGSN
jgi:hypothetical protein